MMATLAACYLAAWAAAVALAVGALGLLALGLVTHGRWLAGPDSPIARALRLQARALPVLAVGFVPVALGVRVLYPWPAATTAYLNVPFWIVRAVGYFAAWSLLARAVVRGSVAAAAAALPIVGLTTMFAATDWLMSREAPWTSTVFGLGFLVGGTTAALALAAVLARRRATPWEAGAAGRLLLALLCLWAYMGLSQGLIIWLANKPSEVPWYVARVHGGWQLAFLALVGGGFVAPFFALLPAAPKRRPRWLAALGLWLVAMHVLDLVWQVRP